MVLEEEEPMIPVWKTGNPYLDKETRKFLYASVTELLAEEGFFRRRGDVEIEETEGYFALNISPGFFAQKGKYFFEGYKDEILRRVEQIRRSLLD